MAAHPRARYIVPMATLPLPPARAADDLWDDLIEGILNDDGAASREHLAAGLPIYYREFETPREAIIKEFPDGRKVVVRVDMAGERPYEPA